jgi:hypothetical protein
MAADPSLVGHELIHAQLIDVSLSEYYLKYDGRIPKTDTAVTIQWNDRSEVIAVDGSGKGSVIGYLPPKYDALVCAACERAFYRGRVIDAREGTIPVVTVWLTRE